MHRPYHQFTQQAWHENRRKQFVRKSTIHWHIGCSGFHYKEWKGSFYPEKLAQRKWFDYYCTHFNTLELNVTFYRFPQPGFLSKWHQASPTLFSFSVKAPRLITHYKKFNDCKQLLSDFYHTVREGLKEKLGPVLFQLPAQIQYDEKKLGQIIAQMDPSYTNVIEFRHASWWQAAVYNTLAAHHITFCGISHPSLPDQAIANTATAYYRFHGVPQLYYSAYERQYLDRVATGLTAAIAVQHAYLYFNNTAGLAAIDNASYLRDKLVSNQPPIYH